MAEQTSALTQMTRDIIRKSTLNGAAIGAIAGCGMAVLSAGNAKSCVTAALSGGAVGAVAGNIKGRQHAAKRVALVSPSALVRSIGKADDRMDAVTRDLPELLKQQDAELVTLNSQVSAGQITEAQFTQRFEVIKANRQQLAEALSLSAAQAEEAHTNLENAQSKGQTGLEWHLSATQNLAREATSARSAISLL
ncbi:hypothetical protein [Planktotalea arctica]|uniref:hypothetical protein n=1 Tax=Planktotalea arctica TaxID=1481893 RepID=UPI001594CF41|nr:hypothetical protein [Planktotalea arctica]